MKGLKFSVGGLAASVVSLYANHLSAKKGYRCLHASCSGGRVVQLMLLMFCGEILVIAPNWH